MLSCPEAEMGHFEEGMSLSIARGALSGARPVQLIIAMIQWIRTSRLSIKNSLSHRLGRLVCRCHRS